jgi:hypothetical protein
MIANLVDKLLRHKLLDEYTAKCVKEQLTQGQSFGQALRLCGVAEEQPLRFLAKELGLDFVELDSCTISREFLSQFPARILLDRHILPLEDGDGLVAVTNEPFDNTGIDELRLTTGKDFQMALAPLVDIDRCIKRFLGVGADTVQTMISEAGENGLQTYT